MRISTRSAKTLVPLVALSFVAAMAPAIADSGSGNDQKSGIIYNSVISPLPGNLDSLGFESLAFNELGNAVKFSTNGNHNLTKVVITMSSWGCASGSWGPSATCNTPEDASFAQPITLNIYNPTTDGANPGAKIASVTKTFDIKYRPSASPECIGTNTGKWYDEDSKRCFNGLAQNITFNVKGVKVGNSAIFGIAYNTTHYGYAPIGQSAPCFSTPQGCGYDSLNVALTQDPTDVSAGSSVDTGKIWFASTYAGWYADGGAAGVGTFRLDSPNVAANWGTVGPNYDSAPWYVPAIKVFANQDGKSDNQSGNTSTATHAVDDKADSKHGIKKD